ncbi:pentatricopeptide repeat-containing protein, partial [Trifolium medium]|nr:pentatricopeptide repeat-containing protein [Trifolium medium]
MVETLSLFLQMNKNNISSVSVEESQRPDNYSVSIVLKSCAGLRKVLLCKMIHGFLIKVGAVKCGWIQVDGEM